MTKETIAEIISTVFYIGKVKYAPGTIGSLIAFPIFFIYITLLLNPGFFILKKFSAFFNFSPINNPITLSINLLVPGVITFFVGIYYSNIYANYLNQHDPKEIIIDEISGQMITLALSIPIAMYMIRENNIDKRLGISTNIILFFLLTPFILFRFFDIVKPWPINWIDQNVKGGVGIMLDDVLAAICASISQYIILLGVSKYFADT